MLHQRALHFVWRYPLTRHAKHVVGASRIPIVTIVILVIFVAGDKPLASHAVLAELAAIPVSRRRAAAANPQVADCAGRHILPGAIDDAHLIAGHRLSRAAG